MWSTFMREKASLLQLAEQKGREAEDVDSAKTGNNNPNYNNWINFQFLDTPYMSSLPINYTRQSYVCGGGCRATKKKICIPFDFGGVPAL